MIDYYLNIIQVNIFLDWLHFQDLALEQATSVCWVSSSESSICFFISGLLCLCYQSKTVPFLDFPKKKKKKKIVPFPSMAQALVSTVMDQLGSLIASEFQDWLGSLFASEFTSIVNEKAVNYRHKVWFIFILPLKF